MHCRSQEPGGVRVQRRVQHLGDRPDLDDTAGIHDRDRVGDLRSDAEIVGDEDHPHAELALQPAQQDQHLHLDGGVERGCRLVGQEEPRIARQRHRDHRALAQATRKLVGIGVEPPCGRRHPHQLEQFEGAGAGGAPVAPDMAAHRLADLLADRVDRIERRHRLLEHHRREPAAQIAELPPRHRQHLPSVDQDLTLDVRRSRQQPQQGAQCHGLARAGFAEDAEDLAPPRAEADPVDRVNRRLARDEADMEVVHLDQGIRVGARRVRHWRPCCGPRPGRAYGRRRYAIAARARDRGPDRRPRTPARRTGSECESGSPRAGRSGLAGRR